MEEFFTRKVAESGRKMPLERPDGEKTEHYLMVAGIDSDRFRKASVIAERETLGAQIIKDEDQRALEINSIERRFVAALVLGWSFDAECNEAAVVEFFKEAPQIQAQVDRFSANRRAFFGSKPTS